MDVSFYFCSFTLFVSWEEFNPLILSVRQEVFSLTAGASSLMFIHNNVKTLQFIHMLNGDKRWHMKYSKIKKSYITITLHIVIRQCAAV